MFCHFVSFVWTSSNNGYSGRWSKTMEGGCRTNSLFLIEETKVFRIQTRGGAGLVMERTCLEKQALVQPVGQLQTVKIVEDRSLTLAI